MAKDVPLLISDLDGTLWDVEKNMHKTTFDAIKFLNNKKIDIIIATGRNPYSANKILSQKGLAFPIIGLNGALSIEKDGHILFKKSISKKHKLKIIQIFRKNNFEPFFYTSDKDAPIIIGNQPTTCKAHLEDLSNIATQMPISLAIEEFDILSFGILGLPFTTLMPLYKALEKAFKRTVFLGPDLTYGGYTLTISSPNTNKANSILQYRKIKGYEKRPIIAVGDGINDIEMLNCADVSISVGLESKKIIPTADFYVDEPENGGWASIIKIIQQYFLK